MLLVGDYIPELLTVQLLSEFCGPLVLANLESPIIGGDLPSPVLKAGPNLNSISIGIDTTRSQINLNLLFTLANNHMMDYGEAGLNSTIAQLGSSKIFGLGGAGKNIEEARRPIIVDENGKRIGIICCREPQFGSATESTAGCADYGYWVFDAIRALRHGYQQPTTNNQQPTTNQPVDYVIVSCHAALEHSPFPSPRLREYYHRLIAAGADVIHGHHAHVPQGWEEVIRQPTTNNQQPRKGLIFYGLGNFVVDPGAWGNANPNYQWSNVVDLKFGDDGIDYKVTPYVVEEKDNVISPRAVGQEEALGEYCAKYNQIACGALKDEATLAGYWQVTCGMLFDRLYGMPLHCPGFSDHRLSMRNRARYVLDAINDFIAAALGRKRVTAATRLRAANFYNCFLCDSHVDAIKAACELEMGNASDCRNQTMVNDCEFLKVNII